MKEQAAMTAVCVSQPPGHCRDEAELKLSQPPTCMHLHINHHLRLARSVACCSTSITCMHTC